MGCTNSTQTTETPVPVAATITTVVPQPTSTSSSPHKTNNNTNTNNTVITNNSQRSLPRSDKTGSLSSVSEVASTASCRQGGRCPPHPIITDTSALSDFESPSPTAQQQQQSPQMVVVDGDKQPSFANPLQPPRRPGSTETLTPSAYQRSWGIRVDAMFGYSMQYPTSWTVSCRSLMSKRFETLFQHTSSGANVHITVSRTSSGNGGGHGGAGSGVPNGRGGGGGGTDGHAYVTHELKTILESGMCAHAELQTLSNGGANKSFYCVHFTTTRQGVRLEGYRFPGPISYVFEVTLGCPEGTWLRYYATLSRMLATLAFPWQTGTEITPADRKLIGRSLDNGSGITAVQLQKLSKNYYPSTPMTNNTTNTSNTQNNVMLYESETSTNDAGSTMHDETEDDALQQLGDDDVGPFGADDDLLDEEDDDDYTPPQSPGSAGTALPHDRQHQTISFEVHDDDDE
eukprot:PhM_4_TR8337/c0_g1_i1/m.22630